MKTIWEGNVEVRKIDQERSSDEDDTGENRQNMTGVKFLIYEFCQVILFFTKILF